MRKKKSWKCSWKCKTFDVSSLGKRKVYLKIYPPHQLQWDYELRIILKYFRKKYKKKQRGLKFSFQLRESVKNLEKFLA